MTMPYLDAEGTFNCKVLPAQQYFLEAKTGTPYIGIPLEVIDGPHVGKHITAKLYLSDAAFDRSVAALADAFDFNGDIEALYNGDVSFEGKQCSIVTEIESYAGTDRCKVSFLNRLGGGVSFKALPKEKFYALLQRTSQAKEIAQAVSGRRNDKEDQTAAGAGKKEDDLPF